jgi:integrase
VPAVKLPSGAVRYVPEQIDAWPGTCVRTRSPTQARTRSRTEEFVPFARDEIDALETELGATYGPLVVFAAKTGLRTNEWVALERRDVDKTARVVTVQRPFPDGVLANYPKTERSRRSVPLTARALAAYERLPAQLSTRLVFPASKGGYVSIDNWCTRKW